MSDPLAAWEALPRPFTSGPWEKTRDPNGDDWLIGRKDDEMGTRGVVWDWADKDAVAIAALPERIAAGDALAERVRVLEGENERLKRNMRHALGDIEAGQPADAEATLRVMLYPVEGP